MATAQEKYYQEGRGPDLRKADPSQPRNNWVVSDMWESHHEIARRIVLGQKNVEIAAALGVSGQMVSMVRNSPIVQDRIAVLKGARDADTVDLAKEIMEIAPDALALLRDIVRGENDGSNASLTLRAKEANNMLARAGHGVPQKVSVESTNVFLTGDDIAEIKRRARLDGAVVDAEYSVIA